MKGLGRKGRTRWAKGEAVPDQCQPAANETKGFPRRCHPEIRQGRGNMAEDSVTTTGIARHGATRLPSVEVDSFNIELKDEEGFLGDRASKGAFRKILDELRQPLKKN